MVTEVKLFPPTARRQTPSRLMHRSRWGPGLDMYWATVNPPMPLAVAVMSSLVALADPVGLFETALAELLEPGGGGGAPPADREGLGAPVSRRESVPAATWAVSEQVPTPT